MKEPFNQNLESESMNKERFWIYYNLLENIALSTIVWDGMPEEIDKRYVERNLLYRAKVLFFEDEQYLALDFTPGANIDIYNNPANFVVNTASGYYNSNLNITNAVPIYANLTRTPETNTLIYYASQLANLSRAIDVNMDICSIMPIYTAPDDMRLTIEQILKKKKMFETAVVGKKGVMDIELKCIGVEAQKYYIGDKLSMQFQNKWNEALTWCGVPNLAVQKKERLITDEVERQQGGSIACRNSRLVARMQGAEIVNEMFGLNLKPRFLNTDISVDGGEEDVELYDTAEVPV